LLVTTFFQVSDGQPRQESSDNSNRDSAAGDANSCSDANDSRGGSHRLHVWPSVELRVVTDQQHVVAVQSRPTTKDAPSTKRADVTSRLVQAPSSTSRIYTGKSSNRRRENDVRVEPPQCLTAMAPSYPAWNYPDQTSSLRCQTLNTPENDHPPVLGRSGPQSPP
jgi:hypothetical protein